MLATEALDSAGMVVPILAAEGTLRLALTPRIGYLMAFLSALMSSGKHPKYHLL